MLSLAYANSAGGKANLDAMGISASALFSGTSAPFDDASVTVGERHPDHHHGSRKKGTLGRQLARIKSVRRLAGQRRTAPFIA